MTATNRLFPNHHSFEIFNDMKIGILGTRGIPNRYGGFEECAEKLALGLVQKGHEVIVYNSVHHEYKDSEWNGVQIVHCKDPEDKLGTAGQFLYDLACINDARHRGFDVVLQLGYTSSSVWWWRWPKGSVNLVNMDGLEWKRSKYSKKVKAFLRHAEGWAAKRADGLIADSTGIQQYLRGRWNKSSTFIPYGAGIYEQPDPRPLEGYGLHAGQYLLLISRMEPENNVETAIKAYLQAGDARPLVIVGNVRNAYGKRLKEAYGNREGIHFFGAIYDTDIINSFRYAAALYFHGHSVGGTNPSLLEAMGCGARIVAHRNVFNEAILGGDALYFSDSAELASIIRDRGNDAFFTKSSAANLAKIRNIYNWPAIVDAYERVMLDAVAQKKKRA